MNATAPRLHLVTAKEIFDGIAPEKRAAMDLDKYAERLRSMSRVLRPIQHGAALTWITVWRMYTFERNIQRWPDGKFYLVNRSYQLWRGHRIAFDREELSEIGCDEWDRRAIVGAHDANFVPMEADCFHRFPRRQLNRYVELVSSLAGAFAQRSA